VNVAIVDDDKLETDQLSEIIKEYAGMNKLDLSLSAFSSAPEFLAGYKPYAYTIIFLDIYMPQMSGIEAARTVLETDRTAIIAFLTSSDEHMPEAFSLHVYDYISKPAGRERIFKVMDDVLMRTTKESAEPVFTFTSNRKTVAVRFSEILLIRTCGRNLEIVDTDGESFETRLAFSEAETRLSSDSRFLTLMRGIIVNMDFITEIRDGICYMAGGESVAVSVRNEKALTTTWQNYRIGSIRAERRERRERK